MRGWRPSACSPVVPVPGLAGLPGSVPEQMGAGLALGWGPARRPVLCGDPTGATGGKGGHPSTLESHGLKGAMLLGDHTREQQEACV